MTARANDLPPGNATGAAGDATRGATTAQAAGAATARPRGAVARGFTRRTFLRGAARGVPVALALPALDVLFDDHGQALAAEAGPRPIERRFVLWFNGNGIPERYWIPTDTGADFTLPPCLTPLAPLLRHVHVLSGVDNSATKLAGPGNGHTNSMSSLLTGRPFTGRGGGGASVDQQIAQKLGSTAGGTARFRSIEVGVAQESFGESMQRNMSWAGQNKPLPPEMLPHRLFDRLFGQRDLGWIARQRSVLDAVRADASLLAPRLPSSDKARLDEYLGAVRDLERAITSLPPAYRDVAPPRADGDLKDWPRIAKLQSDLLVHALASRQTRVATYMLTKCQSLTRFPWLGHTVLRHHDYTHHTQIPGTTVPAMLAMRDIARWHVEELAYLLGRMKAVREGDGTLLDHSCVLFVHEHAEAKDHKNSGHGVIVAGGAGGLRAGLHTRVSGTFGDLYRTAAEEALGLPFSDGEIPTGTNRFAGIWAGASGA